MDSEAYEELTSAPRQAPTLAQPELNHDLAARFASARNKVKKAVTARAKAALGDEELKAKFDGEIPPTAVMIANGENIREDAGFQQIAVQLALIANLFSQKEDDFLAMCQGLIESHESDGKRYNTVEKRKRELSRMYYYMQDNPCYEFSVGALKSLLEDGTPTPDLDPKVDDPEGLLDDELEDLDDNVTLGVRFNAKGIFRKVFDKDTKEYRVQRVSHLGIDSVSMLKNLEGMDVQGFEFDTYLNGEFQARRKITVNNLSSGSLVRQALGGAQSASIQMTDSQANALMDLFRRKAEIKGQVVISLPREGLDVVVLPTPPGQPEHKEVVYVAPSQYGVLTSTGFTNKYRLTTPNGGDGELRSDLMDAPMLQGTADDLTYFETLLHLQTPAIMAPMFGYFLACFMNQILRRLEGQFPLLQVFGNAGSGKTSLAKLLANMHFYRKLPTVWSAGDMTPFALNSMLQSSASIPVIFDEFKKSELGLRRSQQFLLIMRNNYTGNSSGKGHVSKAAGASTLSVVQQASVAPLIFLSEQMESQTAIMDRSVLVYMSQRHEGMVDPNWQLVARGRETLGRFGRTCVDRLFGINDEELYRRLDEFQMMVAQSTTGARMGTRPIYNNAVVLLGLEFGKLVLESILGTKLNASFETMQDSFINILSRTPRNQSEPSKVLSTLADMSARVGDPHQLEYDTDYTLALDDATGKRCLDLHLPNAWDKYSRFRKAQGEEPLFRTEAEFTNSMIRHSSVIDPICAGSVLKKGRPSVRVVRFDLRELYEQEDVGEFQGKLN